MEKKKKDLKKDDSWEDLYKSEEKKYKKYIEATQISNLTEIAQQLSKDFSTTQVLTDY